MTDTRVQGLVSKLVAARDAYDNNLPIMSDAAFDALEEELRRIDPANPFFTRVGSPAPVNGAWPKVKHQIPMGSLNKAQVPDDMATWDKGCGARGPYMIMDKLDGASCFDGETLVHLANGETVSIEEIVRRDLRPRVLSWEPETGLTTEAVVDVHDNGVKDNWVRVNLEDGTSVTVTEDHLFLVPGEGWVKAKDLAGKEILDNH